MGGVSFHFLYDFRLKAALEPGLVVVFFGDAEGLIAGGCAVALGFAEMEGVADNGLSGDAEDGVEKADGIARQQRS